MSEDRADGEMAQAAVRPFLEPQMSDQRLDDDEARERGVSWLSSKRSGGPTTLKKYLDKGVNT